MTPPADAPVRPPRPRTVTIAFWLQLTVVAVLLGLVALLVAQAVDWNAQIDQAARAVPDADPDEVRGERVGNVVMSVLFGLPALLLAAWMAATALPVRRGGNIARIMVFVAGGAELLICLAQGCSGMAVAPLIFATGFAEEPYPEVGGTPADPGDDFWQESRFIETLYDSPSPFDQVLFPLAGFGILTVLMLTAAVVLLLALPPAHRWFVPVTTAPNPAVAFAPVPPPGYGYHPPAIPPGYAPVPPGYVSAAPAFLICPDPAAHRPPPADGGRPAGTPGGEEPSGPVTQGS
ncbi:hypothetical protein [Micromonospora sp. NPDC049497]|uniref:hypothetical protein n=1 Tax=Micromonospora sp. NPDC049497 TaxID=3364273 RepID=UPI003795FC2B